MHQLLVTVTKDSNVVMKIVAKGADAANRCAINLAARIKAMGQLPSPEEAYRLALKYHFGDESSLVVQTSEGFYDKIVGSKDYSAFELYVKTFQMAEFNPRWDCGESDLYELVKL